jgi:hypothetical protein
MDSYSDTDLHIFYDRNLYADLYAQRNTVPHADRHPD